MGISSTFSTLEHSMGVTFSQERWQLEFDILRSSWRIEDWMGSTAQCWATVGMSVHGKKMQSTESPSK